MRGVFAIARHILLPAGIWIGLIAWAQFLQLQNDTPEITYMMVALFAVFWAARSILLCLMWPMENGIFYAFGQLTALAIFYWWPTLVFDGGLGMAFDGPSFGLPAQTAYTDLLINAVILANRFLPLVLITSAIILALGAIAVHARKIEPPADPAPLNSMSKPALPPAPVKRPVQSGYTEIPENPLDAFR